MVRRKNILEQLSRTRIFTGFENPALFFPACYVAPKKGAGNSNPVKNRVLESCSNIFFALGKTKTHCFRLNLGALFLSYKIS